MTQTGGDSARGQEIVAAPRESDVATLTILFGSQTGNAEYLAHQIHGKADSDGITVEISSLEDWLNAGELRVARLMVVTATHDMGHMPDNAQKFWDWLNSLEPGSLDGLPYAVLSIGDSMYDDFCKAGHDIDERLAELGAERIVDGIDCDIDFEFSAQKWAGPAVEKLIAEPAWELKTSIASASPDSTSSEEIRGEARRTARIEGARPLSKSGSDKSVVHYELVIDGGAFEYEPGDSVAIYPLNDDSLVEEWLLIFGDQPVEGIDRPLRSFLRDGVELRLPHPGLIVSLSRLLPNNERIAEIVALVETGEREKLDGWLWGKDVLDVLSELGGLELPIDKLLQELRPIQHRDYSIASSPVKDDGRLHITVNEVSYDRGSRAHRGMASAFLAEKALSKEPFEVRRLPAHEFRLPASHDPVIMIGPGVGVAPFRAFLRHRDAQGSSARNWLFFGDRHREFDWLYEEDFVDFQSRAVLDRLDTAFSRDEAAKHYVQHDMMAHADDLRQWISDGAYIFVCGDKTSMAPDVDKALLAILADPRTGEGGQEALAKLKSEGRYVKDVY